MTAIGRAAIASKGWWAAHRWLLARRLVQLAILAAFVSGPWTGWWLAKGSLNYSLTLDFLPLTDPYVLLQSLLSGQFPYARAWIGVAIVVAAYLLVGGRSYCSWVCPLNPVTDLAADLRRRLRLRGGATLPRHTRYWLLAMTLVLALATGTVAWEPINPVSWLQRGLVFGLAASWAIVAAVFLFDLLLMGNGWCGHLCPVGAFYSILARGAVLRVSAVQRHACNDCMECYALCPEPHVIRTPLKGAEQGATPLILSPNCTNCGRCIDVCAKQVFDFRTRFNGAAAVSN